MAALYLQFPKATVSLTTDYPPYYNYLDVYFGGIKRCALANPDVSVDVRWMPAPGWKPYLKSLRTSPNTTMIGANAFMTDGRIIASRKMAKIKKGIFDFAMHDGRIAHTVTVLRKAIKDTLRYNVLRLPQERIFFEITYPIVYYPLFWYLEYFHNTHLLHASAICTRNKNIVICGLEGVGKTSLTIALLDEASEFLSDNLIFYDEKKVYPCYELIRLSKKDDTSAWKGKITKIQSFKTAKDFFKPVFGMREAGVNPDILIFPQFSSDFSIKELSKDEAVSKAVLLSQLPSELGNYLEYSNLYNLLSTGYNPWIPRHESLGTLLGTVACFEIRMRQKDGLIKNVERIKDFIRNV